MYINIYHILYVYKLLADSQEETPLSLLGYFISSLRFIWPCISPADPACPALPPLTGEKLQRSVSDRKR